MKPPLPIPLRLPALGFAASLLLGSSVFYLALEARTASEVRQQSAQLAARQAERDLHHGPERLARDRAQASLYARLDEAGFLGEEDRLDWISNLARLRASQRLQQLNWRLAPRTASSLSPGLRQSSMVLELAPVDAIRLGQCLDQLRTLAHGRFTVRECSLRPDPSGGQGAASCVLDWWTWHGE